MFPLLPAFAAEIVVFGDSWAEGGADELEDAVHALGLRDLDVDPQGVGGTTAEHWATVDTTALADAVAANPDARWVWLSIGGNDLFAHHYAGNGANNAADFDRNLRLMLDGLHAAHPAVKVVSFGYDFVNFEQSTDCILTAWAYFGTSITTAQVNQYFLDDVGGTMAAVAADHPQFTYVDEAWGAMQVAGGVPHAPNVYLPSPAAMMSDCIHPTSEGYRIVHDAWVDAYWGVDEPTVAVEGPTDVCVGDALVLAAHAEGAERLAWTVDGADAGTAGSVSLDTSMPRAYAVVATAHAGAWDASDEASARVWAAPAAAITGPASVEAGLVATFQAVLGEGEAAAWTAPGGAVVETTEDSSSGTGTSTLVVRWDAPGSYVVGVTLTSAGGCTAGAQVEVGVTPDTGDTGPPDTDADESGANDSGAEETDTDGGTADKAGCGCASTRAPGAGWFVLGALAFAVRRR